MTRRLRTSSDYRHAVAAARAATEAARSGKLVAGHDTPLHCASCGRARAGVASVFKGVPAVCGNAPCLAWAQNEARRQSRLDPTPLRLLPRKPDKPRERRVTLQQLQRQSSSGTPLARSFG